MCKMDKDCSSSDISVKSGLSIESDESKERKKDYVVKDDRKLFALRELFELKKKQILAQLFKKLGIDR